MDNVPDNYIIDIMDDNLTESDSECEETGDNRNSNINKRRRIEQTINRQEKDVIVGMTKLSAHQCPFCLNPCNVNSSKRIHKNNKYNKYFIDSDLCLLIPLVHITTHSVICNDCITKNNEMKLPYSCIFCKKKMARKQYNITQDKEKYYMREYVITAFPTNNLDITDHSTACYACFIKNKQLNIIPVRHMTFYNSNII